MQGRSSLSLVVSVLTLLSCLSQPVRTSLPNNQLLLEGDGGGGEGKHEEGKGMKDKDQLDVGSQISISTNPACQADLTRICGRKPENLPDLDALECILNQKRNAADEVTDGCNNVLWHYRKTITDELGFLKMVEQQSCVDDLERTGCWSPKGQEKEKFQAGFNLVGCVIDNKDKLEKPRCQTLITRLEGVIFSDYEMISQFANKCQDDIKKLQCGRNEMDSSVLKKLPHSQGRTIECLSKNVQDVSQGCAVQILRVVELQSDDFHLDRALYFACRDDREKFCERVQAGNGRVYKCLLRHKLETEMSNVCREQIYRRQKLGWQDYKASGIVSSCRDEIKKYKCRKNASANDKPVRLSQILLCLENEYHKSQDIGGDCMDEIKRHRKELMEDYSVTPELLSACAADKEKFCAEKGIHGKTLHCLMAHAQMRGDDKRLSDRCLAEMENLLKISDVSNDWQVDPVLQQACQKVVDTSSCSKHPPNRVLDCLMNLLTTESGAESDLMNDECESTLMQIQYFMARDFPMDSGLYEACQSDARNICGAKADWADDPRRMDPERGPLVLSCLFRNIANEDKRKVISPGCAQRVKETMRQRAISVHLIPDIEDACMDDLTDFCSENTRPGEELRCLQTHLNELHKTCQQVVTNFTEIEMKLPTVDPLIWRHCREYIVDKCGRDNSEDGDIFDCLVAQKNEMKSKKCKVSVEHMQLLKLKEIRFSPKFKLQCQADVIRYCNEPEMQPLNPWKLVNCLSEKIRDDIIRENTLRISKGCRKQVRSLLLAKLQVEKEGGDNLSMYRLCKNFIDQFCTDVTPGEGRVLECLRENSNKIPTDSQCQEGLLKLEEETNADSKLDLVLNSECSIELSVFCKNKQDPFECLKMNSNSEGFGPKCRKIVRERLIEQGSDLRMNPKLHRSCKLDMKKFCASIKPGQGRMIGCLKNVFVNPKNRLTDTCKEYLEEVFERAAKEDIKYDSDLYLSCKEYMPQCHNSEGKNDPDKGDTEECLKQLYRDRKIQDKKCRAKVALLIQSSMIDIHVDPILNQACAIDLVRHCETVPPGDGRLLKCLFSQLHEEQDSPVKTRLSERCKELLTKRGELFHMAGEAGAPQVDSLVDIVEQVQHSPHRNYLLTTGMSVVGLIFIFGLFCGRATRRTADKIK